MIIYFNLILKLLFFLQNRQTLNGLLKAPLIRMHKSVVHEADMLMDTTPTPTPRVSITTNTNIHNSSNNNDNVNNNNSLQQSLHKKSLHIQSGYGSHDSNDDINNHDINTDDDKQYHYQSVTGNATTIGEIYDANISNNHNQNNDQNMCKETNNNNNNNNNNSWFTYSDQK